MTSRWFILVLFAAPFFMGAYHAPKATGAMIQTISLSKYRGDDPVIELPPAAKNRVSYELEKGSLKTATLTITPKPDAAADFKIDQAFETSMGIRDGDKTLELTKFRHFVSTWEPMTEIVKNTYRFEGLADAKPGQFPAATPQEIQHMAKKFGDDHWEEIAKKCATPQTDPCFIGISKVRLRISAKTDHNWRFIRNVEIREPLG